MYHIIITIIGDPDLLELVYDLLRWENVFAVACASTVDELW